MGTVPGRVVAAVIVASGVMGCRVGSREGGPRSWTIGSAPTVTIGPGGTPETELFRVTGAWRLASGVIAVVNAATGQIRVFDPHGGFIQAFGRSGEGPGEFKDMSWAARFGDTAAVYDGALRRITMVRLDGTPALATTLSVGATDARASDGVTIAGRLTDGRWLVRGSGRPDVTRRGSQRIPGLAGLIGPGASGAIHWLGEVPDLAVLVLAGPNSKMVNVELAAFPAGLATAVTDSAVWFGDTAQDTLVRVDAAGNHSTVRLPDPPAPLTRELIDRVSAGERALAKDQAGRDFVAVKYAAANLPMHLPAYEGLVAGPNGELWVRGSTAAGGPEARYVVLSSAGRPIARVSVPAAFRVTDVGRDYVLGVHSDPDGVETVRMYPLIK